MRASARIVAVVALLAGPALADDSASHCKHALAPLSSSDLPASIAVSLSPWMALHGETWNHTDAIELRERTAGFLWAAHEGDAWIVAYSTGGFACCATKVAGFVPWAGGYRQVMAAPPAFENATCHDIDAFLDRYGDTH